MLLRPPNQAVDPARAEVAHLLRRTGFAPTAAEVDQAAAAGYQPTVDALLARPATNGGDGAPALAFVPPAQLKANRAAVQQDLTRLTIWWLERMRTAPDRLGERLTLFWHGHWATSVQKVRQPALMLTQNRTLRAGALGDFRDLARAMVRDPAMLIWLDGIKNRRTAPNENLGRELMELFTLGVGHYSEDDVKAAARALTGWHVDQTTGLAGFGARQHDPGPELILHTTASFDDQSLVDLIVSRRDSAEFLAGRLWRSLGSVAAPPSPSLIADLAAGYGVTRSLTGLVRALLLHTDFRAAAARQSIVRSPIEWLVGAHRVLAVPIDESTGKQALRALAGMGQTPFEPPSVGGWPFGRGWLTTSAAQVRVEYAARLVERADLGALPGVATASSTAMADALARALTVDAWSTRTMAALTAAGEPRTALAAALVSPEFVVA